MQSEPVLVSGATRYLGGRLVPLLLDSGYRVRVLGCSLSCGSTFLHKSITPVHRV